MDIIIPTYKKKYLNLGCGKKTHKEWINIDFNKTNNDVLIYDLSKKIPLPTESMEMIYCSHMLEHFSPNKGEFFIQECFRVLKSDGIIRLVVPDLEKIVKEYISVLQKNLKKPDALSEKKHTWMIIELYDQMWRNNWGGIMKTYLQDADPTIMDYLTERIGQFVIKNQNMKDKNKPSLLKLVRTTILNKMLSDDEKQWLRVGKVRLSGEVHYWMYDRFNLTRLLEKTGLSLIKIQDEYSSYLKDWDKYRFDTYKNQPLNPQSLYIEARKV